MVIPNPHLEADPVANSFVRGDTQFDTIFLIFPINQFQTPLFTPILKSTITTPALPMPAGEPN